MCGIIGIHGDPNASQTIQLGLYAQQHRGQEAWGMICGDGKNFFPKGLPHKAMGLVFKERSVATPVYLNGMMGIGHVRYSTQGSNILENAQPHFAHPKNFDSERIFLAANGDLTNLKYLRQKLEENGIKVYTTNDGEVLAKIIGYYHFEKGFDLVSAIRQVQQEVYGAFSAVLLSHDSLYAFRDLYGIRPLVMGQKADGQVMFASETVALNTCGFTYLREVARGEIVKVQDGQISSFNYPEINFPPAQCFFEIVYFSRPDSITFGCPVSKFRRTIGKNSALHSLKKSKINSYRNVIVIAVPDSSNEAALGYANCPTCPLPFNIALIRSHYTGRTFIMPTQTIRDFDVSLKFSANQDVCQGKVIIVVDDSIVRGTTNKKINVSLRQAGATEVHTRVMSPPIKYPCHSGMNFHTDELLIAAYLTEDEICQRIGSDTLIYNTTDILQESLAECDLNPDHFCYACLTGKYPYPIPDYQQAA